MSIICSSDKGWVISHYDYTRKIYSNVLSHSGLISLAHKKDLFRIITPLMRDQEVKNCLKDVNEKDFVLSKDLKRKRSKSTQADPEAKCVESQFCELVKLAFEREIFQSSPSEEDYLSNNQIARELAERILRIPHPQSRRKGGNKSNSSCLAQIDASTYLIPPNCTFTSGDLREIDSTQFQTKYDFILLDPPWWNKFIRRKRAKNNTKGYRMLSDDDIGDIPIGSLLGYNGLVGVWCTNAPSHIKAIKETFFPKWGLVYCATWFWVKVTQSGTPIYPFESNHSKKPYERIIFGHIPGRSNLPQEGRIVISIPSSIHSHKPPITEVISKYLPDKPKCMEIFARYLLPHWTSMGDQVLSLQNAQCFETSSGEDFQY